jgi:uncharacterized protein YraI
MKKLQKLALAALVGGASLIPATAMAAVATGAVNVRTGPSTAYAVVDTLYRGERVEIDRCASNGWCYVIKSGPDGWVSSRYLSDDDFDFDDDVGERRPNISFSFSFGRGNGFSFGRPRGGERDLVCLVTFFERSQVEGGADANVQRAEVMPLAQARRLDGPNDRQRIFDYGTNRETRETCNYLNSIN